MSTNFLICVSSSGGISFPSPGACAGFSVLLLENRIKWVILRLSKKGHCDFLLFHPSHSLLSLSPSLSVSVSLSLITNSGEASCHVRRTLKWPWRAHMVKNKGLQATAPESWRLLPTKTWVSLGGDSVILVSFEMPGWHFALLWETPSSHCGHRKSNCQINYWFAVLTLLDLLVIGQH